MEHQQHIRLDESASLPAGLVSAIREHWPEYVSEAICLGAFMVSACVVTALVQHPSSPLRHALPSAFFRTALTGLAMGLTAIAIVYSPVGKRSGAHMNPAITLTFLRLGKIAGLDAGFYIAAQFAGGLLGVLASALALGPIIADSTVGYAATTPGPAGAAAAFGAELAISFGMMLAILKVSNTARFARYTGLFCGALVALYITFESPLSGMSMNPARTLGSALPAGMHGALWIYFVAPLAGMFLAAEAYTRLGRNGRIFCAKVHHTSSTPCIFCDYRNRRAAAAQIEI